MTESAAERDGLLEQQLAAMDPARFELLVFELAKGDLLRAGEPAPERLAAPDGGADILLRGTPEYGARVWQAKHHTAGIAWEKCRKSLLRAAKSWQPAELTFAFSTDISARSEQSWRDLVQLGASRGIRVERWTRSHLISMLADERSLRLRFFGEDGETISEKLSRAAGAGRPIESMEDAVDAARAIASFAGSHDYFVVKLTAGSVDAPAPAFELLPYLTVAMPEGGGEAQVDTWLRDGLPLGEFPADADNLADSPLRSEMVRVLARGEDFAVSVSDLRTCLHESMRAFAGRSEGSARVVASEPIPVRFQLRDGDDSVVSEGVFDAYRVPPRTPMTFAVAGWIGALLVELNVMHVRNDKGDQLVVKLNFDPVFQGDPAACVEATSFLETWHGGATLEFFEPRLFPVRMGIQAAPEQQREALRRDLRSNRRLAEAALEVERRLGIELSLPRQLSDEDATTLVTIAKVLRDGRGTLRLRPATGHYESRLLGRLKEMHRDIPPRNEPLEYQLFGQALAIGIIEWKPPAYTIGRVQNQPGGRVVVELSPKRKSVPFTLVERWTGAKVTSGVRARRGRPLPEQESRIFGLTGQ